MTFSWKNPLIRGYSVNNTCDGMDKLIALHLHLVSSANFYPFSHNSIFYENASTIIPLIVKHTLNIPH